MHRNKIQMEMTGLVNMMASVFLRYFFIGTTPFFYTKDECFLEATALLLARPCSLVD